MMTDEEEILKELRALNHKIDKIVEMLVWSKDYGGVDFASCLKRIMYGAERR